MTFLDLCILSKTSKRHESVLNIICENVVAGIVEILQLVCFSRRL